MCVSDAYRYGNLEPIIVHYRPLSPRSESAGYYIRYSQRTFDLTGMINCNLLAVVLRGITPPCFYRKEKLITRIKPDENLRADFLIHALTA